MSNQNKAVLLARRPESKLTLDDFEIVERQMPVLENNQFLIKNHYFSLDAGFRQWMNEDSADNYLPAMQLGEPVQSIVFGEVVESNNPDYPAGVMVMGRTGWESYSVADGSDLMSIIQPDPSVPVFEYLSALGPAGMTAYFGVTDIGKVKAGDVFVINAAAGGVGCYAGQIAKMLGCKVIGIAGGDEKCNILKAEYGFDEAINYKSEQGLEAQLECLLPNGADVVFDNVGGEMLSVLLGHLAENARIVMCGAISQYGGEEIGIRNMWQLVTKRARAEGFMFSDYYDRAGEAASFLANALQTGQVKSAINMSEGIESVAQAFIDMIDGRGVGKCLVKL